MKAIVLNGFGGPDVMSVEEVDKPVVSEGQVLVNVKATSVNAPDLVQRKGKYPPPKGDSDIPGVEMAGIIESVGAGVTSWQPGDRVMSLVGGGGYAEYATAWADHLIRIPDSMRFEQAACVCETYITAFLNIFMTGNFKNGESILIHGGGGGVNTAAVQLCKTLTPDSTVMVTASPGKIERVRQLGADVVINYKEQAFVEEIKSVTGKKGVHLILDHIGADYLEPNMKSLACGGKLIIIGVTSGIKAELNLALMMVKRQQIIGSVLRSRSIPEKAAITAEFTRTVLPKFADQSITPVIWNVFPLEQVREAHAAMEESRHFGKIVMTV
ncbi:MAG: NAD(P)H-quinone oxidoreductase [Desulfobacterales bacterium]|nr:NAD(P)H-quinone oxidoreductase [Desulfobacterales bacterium]MDD4071934.1 NAD(P)H-quinone oxidoreductase [Desulfobacterales bacterium]MDD4393766.1 NAD(P)H-quinone oxidoreductase [Desulfobacterales bacterium]